MRDIHCIFDKIISISHWKTFDNGAPAEFAPVARCVATRVLAGMRYLPASACFSLSGPRLSLPLFYFSPSLSSSSLPSFSSPHSLFVSSFPPWISPPLDHRPPLLLGTGHGCSDEASAHPPPRHGCAPPTPCPHGALLDPQLPGRATTPTGACYN